MNSQEIQEIKSKEYAEAIRYMDNAKGHLKEARKEGNYYHDVKYVKTACGVAYNGVLLALDCLLLLKGVKPPKKGRKSIEHYTKNIAKLDKKLLNTLNSVYKILHLWGYYDGIEDVIVVKRGFEEAYTIIDWIKP